MTTPRKFAVLFATLFVALLLPALGRADDVIIEGQKGAVRIRVHCEALASPGRRSADAPSVDADEVLAGDLERSAVFTVSRSWVAGQQAFDVQAFVGGKWAVSGGQVRLTGQVLDVPARRAILVRDYTGPVSNWRSLVHRFADDVVMQFTGEPGVSDTRIAYIVREGRNKELFVMDADGAQGTQLTRDKSLAQSPSWSPEGSLLLFTSYKSGVGPQVFVTQSRGGKAYLVSGRKGNNTSAAYSPDGRDIACTLSMDGNAEIYLLDARGGTPRRLTNNRAIDTSPSWSPTGREMAFTSDRGGTPQVYLMDRDGGNVRRLTFDVNYTDSPAWSPKGNLIAFVSRTSSGFDIYVCNADGSGARLVVTGGSNENPRWSPDGRHLVFASTRAGPRGLFVSDLDDREPRRIDTGKQEAMSPAWSPRPAGSK